MFLDRVTHFRINLGGQGMCRSPKKLKSLIEVPYVVDVELHVLSFNMILFQLRSVFLHLVIRFGKKLGDQGKCCSPKKVFSLIEVRM